MAVLAGIDEAGFGPLLGPLTIGFAAFDVPRGRRGLWRELAGAVSADPRRDRERIVVADSKLVFTRNPRGRSRLETTALSFLALADAWGRPPRTGAELLATAPRPTRVPSEVLGRHPWYRYLPQQLPSSADPIALETHTVRLRAVLERRRIALVDAGVRTVPAGELNASYLETGSKSLTLWNKCADVIAHLWTTYAHRGLELVVDRHGGRTRYAPLLARLLPRAELEIVRESPRRCEYRLVGPPTRTGAGARRRRMRVVFAERAETASLPVALASCFAKYTRETCMEAFNAYFGALQADLRPTAGYTTDGRRWLAEAVAALRRADLDPTVLVRQR